jgi:hypothetical protein
MPAGALRAIHRSGENVALTVDAKPSKNVRFFL